MTEPIGNTVGGADSGVCELTSKSRYLGKGPLKRQELKQRGNRVLLH